MRTFKAALGLVVVGLGGLVAPAHANAPGLSWDNLAERLDQEAEDGFSGVIVVVRDGKTVVDGSYGLANREDGIPIRKDTIFGIGSTPIDFTHVGILMLAQQGKLSFRDPITKFFGNVPEDRRSITIDHLMTGRSGLQNFHGVPSDGNPDHAWIDRDEAMRRIFAQELLFEPVMVRLGTEESVSLYRSLPPCSRTGGRHGSGRLCQLRGPGRRQRRHLRRG